MISPADVLERAVTALPILKWALGVAGIAALVAIIAGFEIDYRVAVLGTIIIIALMFVLVVFASAAASVSVFAPVALAAAWLFLILTFVTATLIMTSYFFEWPRPLASTINSIFPEPSPSYTPPRPTPPEPTASPKSSCRELLKDSPSLVSGVYSLRSKRGSVHQAYCDMEHDGGGWTLVAKISRDTSHWHFDSGAWTDREAAFNESSFDLDSGEARYPAYSQTQLTDLRILSPGTGRALIARTEAANPSLWALVAAGPPSKDGTSRFKVIRYDAGLFDPIGTNKLWNVCAAVVERFSSEIIVNIQGTYKAGNGESAISSARLGNLSQGSNDHVWSTVADCVGGLGAKTQGYNEPRQRAGVTDTFVSVWVR